MMKMSQRLLAAASMVDKEAKVADIGCDHAYISIFLIMEHIASSVIAMDVRKGPLEIAQKNISGYGLSGKIETRLSDGFSALQMGETDTAVITGMGGLLITGIIEAGLSKLQKGYKLILGPQSEFYEVRSFLAQHGFQILEEKMLCEDGKYYPLIKVMLGGQIENWNTAELTYGPMLLKNENLVLKEYLQKTLRVQKSILDKITGDSEAGERRKAEVKETIDGIRLALKAYYQEEPI